MARFFALLKLHGIETVIDVRRAPVSRHVPRFNKDRLGPQLTARGFEYLYRGKELGGVPSSFKGDVKRFFAELRDKPEFIVAIGELAGLAARQKTLILCAEADFNRCHRHKLIEPELKSRGIAVLHIDRQGRVVAAPEDDQLSLF